MTTLSYPSPDQPPPPPKDDDCPDCNPGALDGLQCDAVGLQAQATYLQSFAAATTARRGKFDKVRKLYTDARTKAAPDVKDLKNQAQHVKSQLDCLITDTNRKKCLSDAYASVLERLAKCAQTTGGVPAKDCNVSIAAEGLDPVKRFGEIETLTVKAEASFDRLVEEPTQIPIRVQELKARVTALATDVGGDVSKLDLDRAYARLLVILHDLEDVWLGFADENAFYDRLCADLSCSLRGRQALGVLTHHIAVKKCQDDGVTTACDLLATTVVEEVVTICHRRCTPKDDGGGGPSGY